MGNVNAIPVVSQLKSATLAATGNLEEALHVQEDFIHECPVASQITSFVYACDGNNKKALETQQRFAEGLLSAANGIPVIGHIKGGIHYAIGEKDLGDEAMIASSRTTCVVLGGMAGMIGGPVGAVAAGVAAGVGVDVAVTVHDSQKNKEYSPSGVLAAVDSIINDENPSVADIFDSAVGIVLDGAVGYAAGVSMKSTGRMTRTQWRRHLRQNAKLRARGLPTKCVPKSRWYHRGNATKKTGTEWRRMMRKNASAKAGMVEVIAD